MAMISIVGRHCPVVPGPDTVVQRAMQDHMAILRNLVVIGLVTMVELFAAQLGHAQTWLAPAYPASALLGPTTAKGAVIWSHGRSADAEDSEAPTPPFMASLRNGGWDTFRLNRLRAKDTFAESARALVQDVHRLKQQGYRQVVLAGQSFGGFLSLMGADASDEVDAVIATAPAAYGTYADQYDTWRANATELYPLLARVRHARVMLFYFHGDEFDPGGRGERSRDILAERHLEYVVIDQPRQLATHWAASTPLFARLYGDCVLAFLDANHFAPDAQCKGGTYWAAAHAPSQLAVLH
jgi:pimeloyl-ACP methyl ester carboxylesterase